MSRKNDDYFNCPCCGAEVAVGKDFCRECGASDECGWDDGHWWDDELPEGYDGDPDFDYEEFIEREFAGQAPRTAGQRVKQAAIVSVVLALVFALLLQALL